jgi:hypothetical protein
VVFDYGDEDQSNHVHQGSHEVSSGVSQEQSSDHDDDDDDDDDDDHGGRECAGDEDAELVSIHSSKHSTSCHQQNSQRQQQFLNNRSMEMATTIADVGSGGVNDDGSVIHPSTNDRVGNNWGLGLNSFGDIVSALTSNASVSHYSSITGTVVHHTFPTRQAFYFSSLFSTHPYVHPSIHKSTPDLLNPKYLN